MIKPGYRKPRKMNKAEAHLFIEIYGRALFIAFSILFGLTAYITLMKNFAIGG